MKGRRNLEIGSKLLVISIAVLLNACRPNASVADIESVKLDAAGNDILLAKMLAAASGPSDLIASFVEKEFSDLKGSFVRIGKVTVRLWHDDPDSEQRSEFPEFLPPASVSYLQREFQKSLSSSSSQWEFLGCGSSGALSLAGKRELNAGGEAVSACGFLVNKPPEGKLRQFEFYIEGSSQVVYVTTDILQRPAIFRQKALLKSRVAVLTRPDSWGKTIDFVAVKSAPFNLASSSDQKSAQNLKTALQLFNLPSSLSDASVRWYGKQVNVEARKPIIGGTVSAIGAIVGATQLASGVAALTAGSAGAVGAAGAAGSGAVASQTVGTTMAVWKTFAGLMYATSSVAELVQVQRIISLEGDSNKRAITQFAYSVFQTGAKMTALVDVVASSKALFEQVARKYISSRVASALVAEQSAEKLKLLNLQASARKGGIQLAKDGVEVVAGTIQAPVRVHEILTFPGYMINMSKKWYNAGKLTRAVLGDTMKAKALAKAIASRPETYYSDLLKEVVEVATKSTMDSFTKMNVGGAGAKGVLLLIPEAEKNINKAVYEVNYRILTD